MDDQASVQKRDERAPFQQWLASLVRIVGLSISCDDLVSLAELQLKLTIVDFTENARRAAPR